jgi:transposase
MVWIKKYKQGNRVYQAEVKTIRKDGKTYHKYIRYLGPEPTDEEILALQSPEKKRSVRVDLTLLILHQIASDIHLEKILGSNSKQILAIVYARASEAGTISGMRNWLRKSNIGYILGIQKVTERSLYHALDNLEAKDRVLLQQQIYAATKSFYQLKPRGIIYDVTNTYFHGKKCKIAKLGKSKEGKNGKPLIQVGLGITQKEGIPVLHEVFKGNTHDSKIYEAMYNDFQDLGIKKGMFVFDRGFSSETVQNQLKHKDWMVLCGLKISKTLRELAKKETQTGGLLNAKNQILSGNTIFYVKLSSLKIGNSLGKIAICYNPKKAIKIRDSLKKEVKEASEGFRTLSKIKPKLQKYFHSSGRILEEKIEKDIEFSGYSFVFCTNRDLSAQEIVRYYFDKDLIEKAFGILKSVIRIRPIRHYLRRRVYAHAFICFLSLLLLSIIRYRLSKLKIPIESALLALEEGFLLLDFEDPQCSRLIFTQKIQKKIVFAVTPSLLKRMWSVDGG